MPISQLPTEKVVLEKHIREMPEMVRWFDPGVLFKILKPVFISGIFGSYADRRLMQAALDTRLPQEHFSAADIRQRLRPDDQKKLWVDFIADTGDGFASTYTVAWLQAQPTLTVDNIETRRGSLLLLGGDQVYPDATFDSYMVRFRKVFEWAFPDNGEVDDDKHPPVFAIPGNHDWYDGLTYFFAFFCNAKPWKLGNWRAFQRRSYFAIQVTDNIWIWGTDIQLSEDVDSPQAEYFREVAKRMPIGSTIILITAVPGWYDPTSRGFKCLGYVEKIAHKADRKYKVPLVLSGDVHHYARYECKEVGTQLITWGGGGAFLHATNTLRRETAGSWGDKKGKVRTFTLAELEVPETKPAKAEVSAMGAPELPTAKETGTKKLSPACYPSIEQSHKLLIGLTRFPFANWKFSILLGALYCMAGLSSLMWAELYPVVNL